MDSNVTIALAQAARSLGKVRDEEEVLRILANATKLAIPEFNHIGISITERNGRIRTAAATSDTVQELDDLQYELTEGPCYDTIQGVPLVIAPRIRHDQRWPRYIPEAVNTAGLRAQLAVRIYLDDRGTVGGLNLYSTSSDEIDEASPATADLFATHVALALGRTRELNDLNAALESRKVIGQAIGMVMERHALTESAAFAYLARASSHSNVKIRDIAAQMVADANDEAQKLREQHP
jgi:hypothetical protein